MDINFEDIERGILEAIEKGNLGRRLTIDKNELLKKVDETVTTDIFREQLRSKLKPIEGFTKIEEISTKSIPSTIPPIIPSTIPSTIPSAMPSNVPSTVLLFFILYFLQFYLLQILLTPSTIPSIIPSTVPYTIPLAIPSKIQSTIPFTQNTIFPTPVGTISGTPEVTNHASLPVTTFVTTSPSTPATKSLTTSPTTTNTVLPSPQARPAHEAQLLLVYQSQLLLLQLL